MDTNQTNTVAEAVSIPTIMTIVNNISHSDQCLHADTKITEYINLIPNINFNSQEEKNHTLQTSLVSKKKFDQNLTSLNMKNLE
ncbi:hypothetical protein NPIL_387391 [Nephila pilipes]|uniref:Uncharacterized protein n=1 Tax=Nephila pilipes TaxID=299642 RepID=A0A8X6MNR6_NEPPI|nr:hypothetical protein NPIL_387391 [Nephila pilipes]